MAQKRERYDPEFKLKVALEALQEKESVSALASKYSIHSTQINQWQKQLKDQLKDFFSTRKPAQQEDNKVVAQLYQKIGRNEKSFVIIESASYNSTNINNPQREQDKAREPRLKFKFPVDISYPPGLKKHFDTNDRKSNSVIAELKWKQNL